MKTATFGEFMSSLPGDNDTTSKISLGLKKMASGDFVVTHLASGAQLTIEPNMFKPKTKYIISYSPLNGLVMLEHDSLFKSKDQWAYRNQVEVLSNPLANVYFHTEWDNSVIFMNWGAVCNSTPDYVLEGPGYIHDALGQIYNDGSYVIGQNTNLRIETFRDVNMIDSVVALEQQVDVLTRIIKELVTVLPEATTEQLETIESIDALNTLNLLGKTKVMNDMLEHKAFIRNVQEVYLTGRL